MNYNLTEGQKELARWTVKMVRDGALPDPFDAYQEVRSISLTGKNGMIRNAPVKVTMLSCLEKAGLIVTEAKGERAIEITLTERIYTAVDSNFAEDEKVAPISTLAQPHPPEIAMSLDRLRTVYPDPKKLGFLIMRFTAAKPFDNIVKVVKDTATGHGLAVVRADEQEFHSGLWENVRTYLHGCGFGVAVYERIDTNEPNANVGLEVGYLLAMGKPVLLLKDKTLPSIQSDLAGSLYKTFDPHNPETTIPKLMTKWLNDYGIVVTPPGKSS